jgi:hypothetical protein
MITGGDPLDRRTRELADFLAELLVEATGILKARRQAAEQALPQLPPEPDETGERGAPQLLLPSTNDR